MQILILAAALVVMLAAGFVWGYVSGRNDGINEDTSD